MTFLGRTSDVSTGIPLVSFLALSPEVTLADSATEGVRKGLLPCLSLHFLSSFVATISESSLADFKFDAIYCNPRTCVRNPKALRKTRVSDGYLLFLGIFSGSIACGKTGVLANPQSLSCPGSSML